MHLLVNLILALILDSAGFTMYVYFFSIGYGFSIAAISAAMLIMFRSSLLPAHVIMCVLFSGARRLELRQDRNYGHLPAYREYVRTTPILLPFVPLYSVKNYSWLKA